MTTIVYNHRDRALASDSQSTSGYIDMPIKYTKLHRLSFGWVGLCGRACDMDPTIDILEGREVEGDLTKLSIGGIVMPDKGNTYNFYINSLGKLTKEPINCSWSAGSGR